MPFDLKEIGIENTIREADRRQIVHAGTGERSRTPSRRHT
jgi:hypothetical protein